MQHVQGESDRVRQEIRMNNLPLSLLSSLTAQTQSYGHLVLKCGHTNEVSFSSGSSHQLQCSACFTHIHAHITCCAHSEHPAVHYCILRVHVATQCIAIKSHMGLSSSHPPSFPFCLPDSLPFSLLSYLYPCTYALEFMSRSNGPQEDATTM